MDTDKIIQDLNRRFAAPLPEFYQRRIIFWYDEDKEFEDKLDEVVLENAKVIALTGNNSFSVKKLLSVDDLTTNYLVYSPCVYNRPDDNWLLDVELYSEEFRADLISIWMDEITKKESIKRWVEYGRRYAIMQKGVQPDYLMPVKFLGGNTEFDGFAPRESIRIKMNGGGMNFVHGGISLQEMVVPVIEYHYLRNDSMEYRRNKQKYDTKPVTVNLLSANRKISNMIFSLNFYQKDAVSTNREAATYQVYFTDEDGKQMSDIQKIIADKTSDNGAERTFRCQFNLKSLKYSNTATYYLVIADEQGLQLPQREPFQIDIAFAVDEFDFFS